MRGRKFIPMLALPAALMLMALLAPAAARAQQADPGSHSDEPLAPLVEWQARAEAQLQAGELPLSPDQNGAWTGVPIAGATCGRGTPFKFYLNASAKADAGILYLLNGGGACLKEGPAPAGATGIAKGLHCMDFTNFEDPFMNDQYFSGLLSGIVVPQVLPIFARSAENPFRDYHFVAIPYCTGDVFAGAKAEAYDYDPSAASDFEVTHRGHLNVLAVVQHMYERFPEDRPVLLSGLSAGGFGAIFNFPEVIERWPRTTLLPDSGIAPPIDGSLLDREAAQVAARWGADSILPEYCNTPACLSSTYRVLSAHAQYYDGNPGTWRPFGFLNAQQDATLTDYLETTPCGYQLGLRRGLGEGNGKPSNLRAFVPATNKHVFSAINPLDGQFVSTGGVNFLDWYRKIGTATTEAELPGDAVDGWMGCNEVWMPWGGR